MIPIHRSTNVEVGVVTPEQGSTGVTIHLEKKITTNPVIYMQIESMQTLHYNIHYDMETESYTLLLASGQAFNSNDKVNYLVVYL